MSSRPHLLKQDVLRTPSRAMVKYLSDADFTHSLIEDFLESATTGIIGISASYSKDCAITVLALSSETYVLHVTLNRSPRRSSAYIKQSPHRRSRMLLQDRILCNDEYTKISLDMHRVATALFYDHGLFISSAVDLQSFSIDRRTSFSTLLKVLGGSEHVNQENVRRVFLHYGSKSDESQNVAIRAWCAWMSGCTDLFTKGRSSVKPIDTTLLPPMHLQILANTVRIADRLDAMKPVKVKNDVEGKFESKIGALQLKQTRFKTRMRESETQAVVVEVEGKDGTIVKSSGRTTRVRGKDAVVSIKQALPDSGNIAVFTVGKEAPTTAEAERTNVVLDALRRTNTILCNPLIQIIYGLDAQQHSETSRSTSKPVISPKRSLNPSQKRAVDRILSIDQQDKVCLVQGPPGTGKTTVIAASTINLVQPGSKRSVWLIAQSNVAVKNIAEKLADCEFFEFKLLVSFDFHFDWHEHLYEKIEENIIRGDTFKLFSVAGLQVALNGCRVILCTISMLSHPLLVSAGFTQLVPLDTVIVDEASQIEIGDYFPMLNMFGRSISKLVFIGDDKQLPPYGEEEIKELRSIFEMKHLRKRVVFLDTQYRMPSPIGNFISTHVYGGKLRTKHKIHCPSSCRLIDVYHGEEAAQGTSWINHRERDAVLHLAKKYHKEGKSYRIITPYDPQRGLLEEALKQGGLPWEDRCFCVDSFQGNEDDHIIISVVRSDKIGFLKNLRRSNVMLSRCKASMTICTSRAYLNGVASSTLLGKLAKEWGAAGWVSWYDLVNGRF